MVPSTTTIPSAGWDGILKIDKGIYPSVGTATQTAAKVGATGAAVSAEAAGGAAAVGLVVGVAAGSHVAGWMGLPTSGSFVCDVSNLFSASAGCKVAASPAYSANADIVVGVPGWTPSNVVTVPGSSGSGTVQFGVQSPAYGVAGTQVVTWDLVQAPTYNRDTTWTQVVVTTKGGTLAAPSTTNSPLSFSNGQYYSWLPIRTGSITQQTSAGQLVTVSVGGVVKATWRPVGDPQRPPDVDADPLRQWRTTWTCTSGSGGVATSTTFHETDTTWPSPPVANCAAGIAKSAKVEQGTTKAGVVEWVTMYDWTLPPEYTTGNPNPQDCADPGSCTLLLERLSAPGSTKYVSCFSSPAVCADWWTQTAKGTQALDQSDYRCSYGGKALALSECAVYAHAFDQGVYSNPKTGEPPSTSTSTPTDPATPGQDQSCPPPFTWTSLVNPWWYYKGVACALQDAFVPKASTVAAQVTATQTVVMGKPPFSLLGTVQPVFTGLSSGWSAGCSGTIADFDPDHKGRLSIPCTPPQSAPLTALYGVAVMAVVVATAFAVWHMLVAALGGHGAEGAD